MLAGQRYTVTRIAIPHGYRLVVRHGYMDDVITPDLGALVCEQIRRSIVCQARARASQASAASHAMATQHGLAAELATVQRAFDRQVLYIVGQEQMRLKHGTGFVRKMLL